MKLTVSEERVEKGAEDGHSLPDNNDDDRRRNARDAQASGQSSSVKSITSTWPCLGLPVPVIVVAVVVVVVVVAAAASGGGCGRRDFDQGLLLFRSRALPASSAEADVVEPEGVVERLVRIVGGRAVAFTFVAFAAAIAAVAVVGGRVGRAIRAGKTGLLSSSITSTSTTAGRRRPPSWPPPNLVSLLLAENALADRSRLPARACAWLVGDRDEPAFDDDDDDDDNGGEPTSRPALSACGLVVPTGNGGSGSSADADAVLAFSASRRRAHLSSGRAGNVKLASPSLPSSFSSSSEEDKTALCLPFCCSGGRASGGGGERTFFVGDGLPLFALSLVLLLLLVALVLLPAVAAGPSMPGESDTARLREGRLTVPSSSGPSGHGPTASRRGVRSAALAGGLPDARQRAGEEPSPSEEEDESESSTYAGGCFVDFGRARGTLVAGPTTSFIAAAEDDDDDDDERAAAGSLTGERDRPAMFAASLAASRSVLSRSMSYSAFFAWPFTTVVFSTGGFFIGDPAAAAVRSRTTPFARSAARCAFSASLASFSSTPRSNAAQSAGWVCLTSLNGSQRRSGASGGAAGDLLAGFFLPAAAVAAAAPEGACEFEGCCWELEGRYCESELESSSSTTSSPSSPTSPPAVVVVAAATLPASSSSPTIALTSSTNTPGSSASRYSVLSPEDWR